MRDRSLGAMIVVSSLLFMAGYFVWAFAPFLGVGWISREASEWAFKLPILLAVYAFLLVALWIGYTMATTPPPLPLERPLEIEREEAGSAEKGEEEEEP